MLTIKIVNYRIILISVARTSAQYDIRCVMNTSYKKKILSVSLAVVLIALLCTMLSACGLFNSLREIKDVDILVSGANLQEDGTYLATLGDEFVLSVDWNNKRIASPKIEWHVKQGDADEIVGDKKSFTHVFERDDYGKTYTYYVVVNKVTSDEITIVPQEAQLSNPQLSSDSHKIVAGQIQQNLNHGVSDVNLSVDWNEQYISQSLEINVAWYIGADLQDNTAKQFTFITSDIKDVCEITITVEIGYTTDEETVSKRASVTLSFVFNYDLAQTVSICPSEDGGKLKRVTTDTYYLQASSDAENLGVSFTTILLPATANQSANCTWTTYTGDTRTTLDENERELVVPLSVGKNVIKATIDNVDSAQIIVYVLSYDYDELPTDIQQHISNKFLWYGNAYDTYISSQRDLDAYVSYVVSKHKTNVDYGMYLAINSWRNQDLLKEKLGNTMSNLDESGSFAYTISINDTIATLTFTDGSVFGIPTSSYESNFVSNQVASYLRYTEQNGARETLPIDSSKKQLAVTDSNELYRAVSCGYKPIFEGENADSLSALYQKARNVLTKYVRDNMSDVEKVAAIYDWIVYEIDYDTPLANMLSTSNVSQYNAFYLEGVFNDGKAVCDGKSKAFSLLCGMEGITSLRIRGYADGGGHAWNKVLVDANEDGVKEWYVVDTTWGDVAVNQSENGQDEYLNYSYYLRTDADISSTHTSTQEQPVANTVYNTYQNTYLTINETKVDLYVETARELSQLIEYSKANNCISLSVYIADGVTLTNCSYIKPRDGEYVIRAMQDVDF